MSLFQEFQKTDIWQTLNDGQRKFVEVFFSGKNIYLSGSAGCGKSYVTKALVDFLQSKGKSVGKTALTGVAAFNIGGQTIHSFAGLGLAQEDVQTIINSVKKNKRAKKRIMAVKILLIDEISMAKGSLLNKLDMVLKYFRMNNEPFGGIQLLVTGDMLQLAPIFKNDEEKEFPFECRAWKEANIQIITLTKSMRHKDDLDFDNLLNDIRIGKTDDLSLLKQCIGRKFPDDGIKPVIIYCKNIDVNEENRRQLQQIKAPSKFFHAKDSGLPHHIEAFNKNCPAAQVIELKVGAQVMLLRNLDVKQGLVNGSVGVVRAFLNNGIEVKFAKQTALVEEVDWEITEQDVSLTGEIKYKVVATRHQLPLRVAYSSTVHKCQSMTLDRAIVDMNGAFSSGMIFVALSRVRDLNSLSIVDFPAHKIYADKKCMDFYNKYI